MQGNQQTNLKYILLGIVVIGIFQQVSFLRSSSSSTPTATPKTHTAQPNHEHHQHTHHHEDTNTNYNNHQQIHQHQQHQRHQGPPHSSKKYSTQDLSNLHLSVLYCSSCSYASSFQQLKQTLLISYPLLTVTGSQYPLPPLQKLLSTVLSYAQYGLIGVGILGDRVGFIAQNPLYQRIRQNKMMYLMGGYFLINFAQSAVSSSGAFEVYLNGEEVFSKKRVGRMPEAGEIVGLIEQRVRGD